MPSTKQPRKGSMQFWPRKRASRAYAKVRSWSNLKEPLPSGFAGYKVGMTHLMITDNHPTSMTKGSEIRCPVTIIECPPLKIISIIFYKNNNILTSIFSEKLDKELKRKITLPKDPSTSKKFDDVKDFDDLKILSSTQPKHTTTGKKKPEIFQLAVGGTLDDKARYAKDILGKEIKLSDVFKEGQIVDIHAVTKGKGFQGSVKRFGVAIRGRKSEKTKRGVGSLGDWKHKSLWRIAHPGQMGYHQRFEHNKKIMKIGTDPKEINPDSGFNSYGIVKNDYILIKGSVAGARKRTIIFTAPIRPNEKIGKDPSNITFIKK